MHSCRHMDQIASEALLQRRIQGRAQEKDQVSQEVGDEEKNAAHFTGSLTRNQRSEDQVTNAWLQEGGGDRSR